jgi:hypothetical protein
MIDIATFTTAVAAIFFLVGTASFEKDAKPTEDTPKP